MADTKHTLREVLNCLYPGEEPNIHEVLTSGANYTSALFEVKIGTRSLFAKVANVSDYMRVLLNADHMYATELCVYSQLAPLYVELQQKIPEEFKYCFPAYSGGDGTVGQETVVMEDLRARGYKTLDRIVSVNWEQASSAMTTLANFHALSFALSRSKPELFKEFTSKLVTLRLYDTADGSSKRTTDHLVASAFEAVRNPQHKEKMRKFFAEREFKNEFFKLRQPLDVPVICHGDYRPSNLLFKQTVNSGHTIPVDYQTVHTGCPASDLAHFVVMGTDQNFRRQHYENLLQHYHRQLGLALKAYGLQIDDVYSWDTFQNELKQMLPSALMVGVFMLPMATVEEDRARAVQDNISDFAIAPSTLFEQRFDTLVQDLILWGVL